MQEGLANALKHANCAHADVIVRYAGDGVEVEIADDGAAANGAGRSEGERLAGMRERVGALRRDARDRAARRRRLTWCARSFRVEARAVIRVLLVDDQALVRAGFRMILDAEPEIEVVGEAADGRDAIDQVRRFGRTSC